MQTVVIARTGSPFFVTGKGASAIGEDDTQCVVERVADMGYNTVYFGHVKNRELLRSDVKVLAPDLNGINEDSTGAEIAERLDPLVDELRRMDPVICLNVAGAPPSWSWTENPNGAFTQAFAVRYSCPALYMMHKLALKRALIITDPKVYPRDCEMSTCWPEIVPCAVLSQEETVFRKTIQDVAYSVVCKYAACEFWRTQGWKRKTWQKTIPFSICAHSHRGNPRLGKGRDDIWPSILDDPRFQVCGKGWEGTPQWAGVIPSEQLDEFIGQGMAGPMIPQKVGFNTTKPRMYALNGTIPLLYGRGGPYTYDIDERILPLDSPFRIEKLSDPFDDCIEHVLKVTEPNWTMLEQLLEEGPNPEKFGGYIA